MIHVDRNSVNAPSVLGSKRAQVAFKKAKAFYETSLNSRLQRRHPFEIKIWKDREVRQILFILFNGKCAYCENKIGSAGHGEVDQFRPKGGAYDANMNFVPDHYWWLAYDWRNLYLSCQICNSNKGSHFPVKGQRARVPRGEQAKHNAPWFWDELQSERPLLLDPCADKLNPGDHLLFDEQGIVAHLTEEGRVTIETFKLNRNELVKERKSAVLQTDTLLSSLLTFLKRRKTLTASLLDKIRKAQAPSHPHAAVRRARARLWWSEHAKAFPALQSPEIEGIFFNAEGLSTRITGAAAKAIVKKSVVEQKKKEEERVDASKLEGQYITRVELHNFRAIDHLEMEFPAVREEHTPWLVLLGENGVGKSSILKAVALALMDKEHYRKLHLDASAFVRYGQRNGYVKVHTTSHSEPFELHFERGRTSFTKANNNRLQTILLGYGGTRLLPRDKHKPAQLDGFTRVENLFDPFLPLMDAEAWLLALTRKPFGYGARAIKDLLMRDDETQLIRRGGGVKLKSASAPAGVPLEELSDGYQSMVALGTDMMKVLMSGWGLAEKAQGIVLIDELDVHLHPRWKMQIVSSLQRAFPRVQFIVTTHDPLCLKGTRPGEVRVLNRLQDASPVSATNVDVPPGATADQLLTGFWFGLSSTIDDETLLLIEEHHKLLRGRETAANLRRRGYLEEELHRRLGVYADTSVDRMAQSVAAQLMTGDLRTLGPGERMRLRVQLQQGLTQKAKKGVAK